MILEKIKTQQKKRSVTNHHLGLKLQNEGITHRSTVHRILEGGSAKTLATLDALLKELGLEVRARK